MSERGGSRPLIFINYRRADGDAMAGRIRDRLASALPEWDVFMDVASIEAGTDFRHGILDAIERARVFVIVIGDRWLGEIKPRLADQEDYVRYEIRTALARGARILPVTVNNTRMPGLAELPEDIADLAAIHAIELRHSRFDDDFGKLIVAIAGDRRGPRRGRGRDRWLRTALGGGIGLGLGLALLVLHFEATGRSISERIGEGGATLLLPFCVAAGALAGFFARRRR